MMVVSDTSPIANLAAIGHLNLLRHLYDRVIIPQAVYAEIMHAGKDHPAVTAFQSADWIETRQATNQIAILSLKLELDDGEAEAIALAVELKADLLLVDERKGRIVAERFGLRFIGLMGVLVEAKQKGFIPAVKPILDDLIGKAGFWIDERLYKHILQSAGE